MLNTAIVTMGTYLLTGVEYAWDQMGIGKIASVLYIVKHGCQMDHPAPIPINALPVEYVGMQTSTDDFLHMKKACNAFLEQHPDINCRSSPNEYRILNSYCITTLGFLWNQKNSLALRKEAASTLLPFFSGHHVGIDHRGTPAGQFVEAALSNKGIDFFDDLAKVDMNLTLHFLKHARTIEKEDKIDFIVRHFQLYLYGATDFFHRLGRSGGTPMHRLITQPVDKRMLAIILKKSVPDFLRQERENLLNRVQEAERIPPEAKQRLVDFLLLSPEQRDEQFLKGLPLGVI